ncbi:hypothetical protein CL653_03165 [bacterium]|nr:hypothetical protein [bacterium]|tara:strand:- start:422 stop:742 length:321 start_codon:yes stop_codon:yes gene_type:complete
MIKISTRYGKYYDSYPIHEVRSSDYEFTVYINSSAIYFTITAKHLWEGEHISFGVATGLIGKYVDELVGVEDTLVTLSSKCEKWSFPMMINDHSITQMITLEQLGL